jgi:ABC-type lipoprotein release transport system permease subunit
VVTQRTKEIGIRLALGAEHGDISRLFVRQGWSSQPWYPFRIDRRGRIDESDVGAAFGVTAFDPVIVVAALSLGATALSRRRAGATRDRVDPAEALRWEA